MMKTREEIQNEVLKEVLDTWHDTYSDKEIKRFKALMTRYHECLCGTISHDEYCKCEEPRRGICVTIRT